MANVDKAWEESKKHKKCEAPWFQNPANCKIGHTYIFKRFVNGHESRGKFLEKVIINTGHYSPGEDVYSYVFEIENTGMPGKTYKMGFLENNNDGCFREVRSHEGGARHRTRKATRRTKSRRGRK